MAGQFPAAIIHEPDDSRFEQTRPPTTTTRPRTRHQISFIVIQMFCQRTLRRISDQFGLDDPRRFTLFFLNEFLRIFICSLKIGCSERFPTVNWHVADTIAQIIAACRLQLAVFAELPFFNFEDHDCLHSSE